VLLSAGLDSAVLAASEARRDTVHPIYVSCGLAWEDQELAAVDRLLAVPVFAGAERIARLAFTIRDLYPETHWAIRGEPPAFDTPDEHVYLAGRNIVLLSKAAIHCARQGVERLALGTLAGNPFPDATPAFFAAAARALSLGLNHRVEIAAPFARMQKSDVIRLGVELGVPLELTLSCLNPSDARHCGLCSKCRERRDAFRDAGIDDPTEYVTRPPR
jgi:7-cyano-7-deazaguanine synthase